MATRKKKAVVEKVDTFIVDQSVVDNAEITADSLMEGFSWSESKEGFEYWEKVYDRLREIAQLPVPKEKCKCCGQVLPE